MVDSVQNTNACIQLRFFRNLLQSARWYLCFFLFSFFKLHRLILLRYLVVFKIVVLMLRAIVASYFQGVFFYCKKYKIHAIYEKYLLVHINHFLNVSFLILFVALNKQEMMKNLSLQFLLFRTKKCFDI